MGEFMEARNKFAVNTENIEYRKEVWPGDSSPV